MTAYPFTFADVIELFVEGYGQPLQPFDVSMWREPLLPQGQCLNNAMLVASRRPGWHVVVGVIPHTQESIPHSWVADPSGTHWEVTDNHVVRRVPGAACGTYHGLVLRRPPSWP